MSKYTFTFKKDDIFVEFITEDKDIVERQFQLWVADADEYAKNGYVKPSKKKIVEEKKQAEPVVEEKPAEVIEEKASEPETQVEQAQEEDQQLQSFESLQAEEAAAITAEVETEEIKEEEKGEVFNKASNLLKTINTIQNPQPEEKIVEPVANFEDVLEKTIENPTFEPTRTKDPIFLNLVKSKNTSDKFHYLMITAYYLSEFEKSERFSLKQINAKLMQNLSEVIDHAMLQEAINQNLIELVPDLTGTSEVGEYRLTRIGEEFFANKI